MFSLREQVAAASSTAASQARAQGGRSGGAGGRSEAAGGRAVDRLELSHAGAIRVCAAAGAGVGAGGRASCEDALLRLSPHQSDPFPAKNTLGVHAQGAQAGGGRERGRGGGGGDEGRTLRELAQVWLLS